MASLTATSTLQASASKSAEVCQKAASGSVAIAQYVLQFADLPLWMQVDPTIQRGYRRQSDSFQACFWSLFYSHNELINVWSHLLPGLFFLGLLLTADYSTLLGGVEISVGDRLMIQIYVAGVAGCLFLSVSRPYPGIPLFSKHPTNCPHMLCIRPRPLIELPSAGNFPQHQRPLRENRPLLSQTRLPRHHTKHIRHQYLIHILRFAWQIAPPNHLHHAQHHLRSRGVSSPAEAACGRARGSSVEVSLTRLSNFKYTYKKLYIFKTKSEERQYC